MDIYAEMGVRRVINACGHATMLGGSILSSNVLDAMIEANHYYVDMVELIERTGKTIADILGAGGGLVTCGGASALVLATAACIAGKDPVKAMQLPESKGMKNEVIVQKDSRTVYDRCVTVAGGKLIEVAGEEGRCVEDAINEKTAAIFSLRGAKNTVPIEELVKIGKKRNVPTILDAAGDTYPPEKMEYYVKMGVDLVSQGAKYFDGPSSAGILYGRKDLVDAAAFHSFTSFECANYPDYYPNHATGCLPFGRAMKVDRQIVVATVVALKRWFEKDHRLEFEDWHKKAEHLARELNAIRGVAAMTSDIPWGERTGISTCVRVTFDKRALRTTNSIGIAKSLQAGNPSIWVKRSGDEIIMSTETLVDGDEQVIIERLRALLS